MAKDTHSFWEHVRKIDITDGIGEMTFINISHGEGFIITMFAKK